ncbi:CCA tRNA nucleotidyltransferase [Heyndrickxia sporothermodurans]
MIEPFRSAIYIIQKLEEKGFEAYFVGGSVRDFLLKRPIHDVDIATSATPEELKKLFSNTVDIGIAHGTILILHQGNGYEVTTFRAESEYIDFRRPEKVKFIRSLFEDLQRRDFTMNAIAMDKNGQMIDPFNGQQCIQEKMIQAVGNPDERFQEDALRMIRAMRFVSQLDFSLQPQTKKAIEKNADLLKHIAIERLFAEFTKLLNGANKKHAIELLFETGLYKFIPGFSESKEMFLDCKNLDINQLSENQMWLLFIYFSKTESAEKLLRAWKMPSKKIKYLTKALSILHTRLKNEWTTYSLYQATKAISIDVEVVNKTIKKETVANVEKDMNEIFSKMVIQQRDQMDVTGEDLMKWFNRTGGPWIKQLLNDIEKAIVMDKIPNEKAGIKGWIQTCNHQQGNDY